MADEERAGEDATDGAARAAEDRDTSQAEDAATPEDPPPETASAPSDEAERVDRDGGAVPVPPSSEAPPTLPLPVRVRPPRRGGSLFSAQVVTLTVLVTLLFLMVLLIEPTPRWLVLFGAGVAALSVDGILRTLRREPFQSERDTAPFLFLPALYVLAIPIFLEHNVRGYWAVPAALAGGAVFGAVVIAQVASVREHERAYGPGRLVAVGATYFVAFAMFSLTYTFDLGLRPAAAAAALISLLLAVEVLHEGEIDPLETLVLAAASALVVGEVRWTLHFLPLDGYLAAFTLLLAFYFVTGLLHSHVTRHLTAPVAVEYLVTGGAGLALVIAARAGGIA